MSRAYSSREVAQLIGADPSSVNRWIDAGKMKAYRTPGGHRRVLDQDLRKFLDHCGMPLPHELEAPRPARRRSVLIVDDDKLFLRCMQRCLKRSDPGLEVETCTSGIEALIRIGAHLPDVVVIDVYMPGVDGVEVCEKLKSNPETRRTDVVAITGRPSQQLEERLQQAGASAVLVKPVTPERLLSVIEDQPVQALSS